MAFTQKQLRFTFDMPAPAPSQGPTQGGEPIASNANRLTISGLRATAVISKGGSIDHGQAELTIYGLTLSHMNRLATFGELIDAQRRNVVTVEAGDEKTGMAVVYQATIVDAASDFAAMPNNSFHILAQPTALINVQPIPPTTINGFADVATIMSGLARQAGYGFNNSGVNKQLYCPYFPGTIGDQLKRCAAHADVEYTIDNQTLYIWPRGGARNSQALVIAPDTGMIGYPALRFARIQVTTLYNPSVVFGMMISVRRSAIPPANRDWRIMSLVHELSTATPNGPWRTHIEAGYPELVQA